MNKKLFLILKLISGILLIYFGIYQINNLELLEFRLIENGISNWTISPSLIRLIIFLEIFIGAILLIPINLKKLNFTILSLLIFVFTIDIIFSLSNTLVSTEKYALIGLSLPLQIVTIILLLSTLIFSIRSDIKDLKYKWIKYIIPIPIAIIVFAMAPIYIDDYLISDSTVENAVLDWDLVDQYTDKESTLKDTTTLIVFFSSTCPHCNRMATMLSINERINSPSINVLIVMPSTIKNANDFMDRNKCDIPYVRISPNEFVSLAGNSVPIFYLVKNKAETNKWTGRTFSLRLIDQLLGA